MPRNVAQMRLPIRPACGADRPSPRCRPSFVSVTIRSARWVLATVSRRPRVEMRISSAAIDVGLENAPQIVSMTNAVRARTLPLRTAGGGSSSRASSNSPKPLSTTAINKPSRSPKWYWTTPQVTPARSVMCRTLGGANPSSRMQRTVSSMTTARVRSARAWVPVGGRRGAVIAFGLPQHAAHVVGRPQIMRGKDSARSPADGVDDVHGAGCGGDDTALVMVDARYPHVGVDLDAGAALDADAVHTEMSVGRIRPVRGGRIGEPVDVFHGDEHVIAAQALDREANGGHLSWFDVHHGALDQVGRDPLVVAFPYLVEFDAEIAGQAPNLGAPHRRENAGGEEDGQVIRR